MHRTVTADISADQDTVAAIVSDLGSYPAWVEFVSGVEAAPADSGDPGTAWFVTLKARVGPFARSKKLRMVQASAEGSASPARFVRRELDGRDHAAWILEAQVSGGPNGAGSNVTMDLRYEGGLWSAPLDAVLGSQVDGAIAGLNEYAQTAA